MGVDRGGVGDLDAEVVERSRGAGAAVLGRLLDEHQIQRRVLDAEDALGLDDGRPHTIAVTVNETGTHLYADGYECFSTTLPAFLTQIGLTDVVIDPDGIRKLVPYLDTLRWALIAIALIFPLWGWRRFPVPARAPFGSPGQ